MKSLKAIVTSNVTNKVTDMIKMFDGCSNLENIDALKDWNINNIIYERDVLCLFLI